MTSSAGRFTTLRLGDGSPSSQGIPDCYKGKRGQQLWIPCYRTQKTQKGSTLIIHILGIISVDHHFFRIIHFPTSWFPSHLPVAHGNSPCAPGAVSPKLQVLDSLLPQVVEKADGRIRGKDGCRVSSRNRCVGTSFETKKTSSERWDWLPYLRVCLKHNFSQLYAY